LEDGVNDLVITCRIVSVYSSLSTVTVRIFGAPGKNFTITMAPEDHVTEKKLAEDNRYVVKVDPSPETVRTTGFHWHSAVVIICLTSCVTTWQPAAEGREV